MDLNTNCSEYTQVLTDSDNVKIIFTAIDDVIMTSHCLAKVGASLLHAISRDPKDIIFFASTWHLLVLRAVISCIMLWNLRQFRQ